MTVRPDGRSSSQIRPTRLTPGFMPYAEGSVLIESGDTRVVCAATVQDTAPPFLKGTGRGWVTAEYRMLPRATTTRTTREGLPSGLSGRTQEIQRLIGRSLRASIDLTHLGERTIVVDCDVVQADGGTRTAAINGGYVALALAVAGLQRAGTLDSSPMIRAVGAMSVGVVDGEPMVDLCYAEDSRAETDFNVVMTDGGEFVEVQGTAEREPFSRSELTRLLDLAEAGIREILALQTHCLASCLR